MQVISTNNLYTNTVGEALNVQSQWSTAETQQASGLQAQDFGTLGGGSSREMLNLETDIAQSSSWASVAKTVGTTTQAMYTAVGTMQTDVNKVQTLISSAMASPNNNDLLGQAQSIMATLMTQVNQQVGGNYLFAGGNTSVAPVSLSNYPTLEAGTDSNGNPTLTYDPSTPDTGYYKGDNSIASVQVNLQQTISYGVTATNPAIEEAIRSVQAVIEAAQVSANGTTTSTSPSAPTSVGGGTLTINGTNYTIAGGASLSQIAASINSQANGNGITASVVPDTAGNYHLRVSNQQAAMTIDDEAGLGLSSASPLPAAQLTDALQSSLTYANKAVADLGSLQEDISNTSNTLSTAQTTQTSFVTYLQNSLSNVKDVDTAQAAAQVQQYQTQLQASFLAVSTLTKLSLASML
jgi:flagellin-like hook-associated protein FlgL